METGNASAWVEWSPIAAQRLDRLVQALYPDGRGPMSDQELAVYVTGCAACPPLGPDEVAHLRDGSAVRVRWSHSAALAQLFGKEEAFFWDERYAADVERELSALAELQRRGLSFYPCTRNGQSAAPSLVLELVERAVEIGDLPA